MDQLLKGPVDQSRMGQTNCSWSMSPDPNEWDREKDCPNQAKHHIMWEDKTMSQVCDEHLSVIGHRLSEGAISTLMKHALSPECSTEGAMWIVGHNKCFLPVAASRSAHG